MNPSQFLIILLARKKIILLVALLTVITATVVSLLLPKNYLATTKVLINYKGVDPVTGTAIPAQLMPGYMGTQVDIIRSRSVAFDVVKKLGLTEIPSIKEDYAKSVENNNVQIEDWLADKLVTKLDIIPSKESSVIAIAYKGVEPTFAATMANAFAESYVAVNLKLKMDPAIKASQYLSEQTKVLRENLQQAQARLSNYQQEHGLTSIQEAFDVENSKLRDLSSQYGAMQSQSNDANSRRYDAAKNTSDSPDVVQNPVIQNFRMSLINAESKLAEMGQRLSKNHPTYIAAEAEAAKIRSQLQTEIDRTVTSLSNSANINTQRLSDVRSQMEKQKQKVLTLNKSRSESMLMEKEVEIAQNALASVTNRFSQTALEGQSNQADISILEAANPPSSPSNPSVLLIIPFSLVVGLFLGCFFALISEFLDRRIRSKDDIIGLAQIPVYEYSVVKA
jgi:polysaccharide biosynthesis transport protein